MIKSIDHTTQVEQRAVAIRINKADGCAFFCSRVGCLAEIKECWYCVYGFFEDAEQGLCKFRNTAVKF